MADTQADKSGGLRADLSSRELFSLAFGAVVGVSWVILVGPWIGGAGSVGSNLAFILGGLLILPIGLCYGELGQRYPATGGEYVYAYRFFGARMAFATAWGLALLYVAVCAFEAISVPWLTFEIFPGLRGAELYSIGGKSLHVGEVVAAISATLGLCWLQLRGASLAARVQDVLVFGLIAFVLIFCAAGLMNGKTENLQPYFGTGWSGFTALLLTTPLFYAGFGAVPQALGESSPQALKRIPAIITIVIVAAIVFHVVVIVPSALVMTPAEAVGSSLPVALAFERAFGSQAMSTGALVAALLALVTTWNAALFSASRVLYALGHGRLGPPILGQRDARRGVPVVTVLLVSVLTLVGVPFGKELLAPVIAIGGLSVTLVFMMIAGCVLRSRLEARRSDDPQTKTSIWLPLLSLAIAIGMVALNGVEMGRKLFAGNFVELAVLGAWTLLGVAVWWSARHTRAALSKEERDHLIFAKQVKTL